MIPHQALDAWLDARFEAAAPIEPLLETFAAQGLGIADVERMLRAGRAAYPEPPQERGAVTADIPLECDHVDHRVRYFIYVPRAYDSRRAWPLVVIGHGGSAARDLEFCSCVALEGLAPWREVAEAHGFFLVAPVSDRGWGAIGNSILFSAISRVTREYHIDPDRIYLTGHSMGGHLAWRSAINFADRWGAVSPMSGGYDYVANREVDNLYNVPGYATWGSHEPYRIDEYNRGIKAWMGEHGYPWVNVEKPGGHEIFADEIPRVAEYFLRHPRDLYRPIVVARAGGSLEFDTPDTHPQWGRRHAWIPDRPILVSTFHWMRLAPLPPETPSDRAVQEIAVVNLGGNHFEIKSRNARRLRFYLHPRMVDLSAEIVVTANGQSVFRGWATPDLATMLHLVREFDDRGRIFHAAIDLELPERAAAGRVA